MQIIHTNPPLASENSPQFAVDVGELGGMYAGKIHLIGTETGVGVRNAGHIGASSDTLHIDSQGRIINTGTLNAQKQVHLTGTTGIENTGKIENRQENIQLTTQADIKQDGSVVARGGDIHKKATKAITQQGETVAKGNITYTAPTIQATTDSLLAAGVMITENDKGETRQLDTQSAEGKSIQLTATDNTTLQGKNLASGNLIVNAERIDLNHSQNSAHRITAQAKTGNIEANSATLVAQDALTLSTPQTLSTQSSQLSANTIKTTQQSLNAKNAIWTQTGEGDFRLKADTINTQGGRFTTQGNFFVEGKHLENSEGTLSSGKSLNLNVTEAIHSSSGRLIAGNNLSTTTTNLENRNGLIYAKQAVTLNVTESIQNQYTQAENQGIVAGQNLSLNSKVIDNTQGKIISNQNANFSVQVMHNKSGEILVGNIAELNTTTMDNQSGLIASTKGNLHLTTHSILNNQQGLISAADNLSLDTQGLSNQHGTIYAEGELNATVQQTANNTFGLIQGNRQLTLSANLIDNQSGKISTTSGTLTANQLDNSANTDIGFVISADKLTLKVSQLNNQGTKAKAKVPTQGIQANNVTLTAEHINNQQGGIYTLDTADLTIKKHLDNQQGEIVSANAIDLKHEGSLMVNNQAGLIQANKRIDLKMKGLEAEGNIKTEGDLSIALKDNFTLNKAFEVGNNFTLLTEGNFENNAVQTVKNKATFTANRITNNANAEISANETTLNSTELTNRGVIDGNKTRINSAYVTNIGTGRIYGNHLAFKAETINNLAESVNGEIKAGTIAARERLDIGVETLTNRDHSLILSLGDLSIGGDLDSDDNAIGNAKFVDNGSATIEALRNGYIATAYLRNHNLNFSTKQVALPTTYHKEYATTKSGEKLSGGRYDRRSSAKNQSYASYYTQDGKRIDSRDWFIWDYRIESNKTEIDTTDPAKILIGGELGLVGQIENDKSQIIIGQTLSPMSSKVENRDNDGFIATTHIGDFTRSYVKRSWYKRKKRPRRFEDTHSYIAPQPDQTFGLGAWTFLEKINFLEYSSNANVETKKLAKEINLDTIKVDRQEPQFNLASQDSAKTHLVSSGQVLGKLDTTIANLEDGDLKFPTIKTHLVDVHLPTASLYRINPDHPQGYLVETDPKFTQRQQWLSSDYMFEQLRHNHENVHKRLGDGFYEQRLINEQINQLTGRRFIEGYRNDLEQYKALMDSGVKYAKQFNLSIGVGLTAQQMSELTTDMVWLVNKEFTLPSGQKVTALTPQVYLVARNSDITSRGALISANEIIGRVDKLENSGVIAGRDLSHIRTNQLENRGVILGNTVDLSAKQNLINLGGRIEAVNSLFLEAGKKLEVSSTLSHSKSADGNFERTILDQVGTVKVTGTNGHLKLKSDGELTVKGAVVEGEGTLQAEGKDITITTLNLKNKEHYEGDADNYYRLDQKSEAGSQVTGKNGVTLVAEKAVNLRQASLDSADGNVTITAKEGNVNIEAGRAEEQLATSSKSTSKGLLSKTTEINRHEHNTTNAMGSELDGKNITITAVQGNITVKGSAVVAEQDLTLSGHQGVAIVSDINTHYQKDDSEKSKKGLMGSGGGIGFMVGKKKETIEADNTQESAARSQVGSLQGNTTIVTTGAYQQTGSIVTSQAGNVNITAQSANITAARSDYESHYKRTMEQKGVTIAVNIPAVQAIQAVGSALNSAKSVGNSKNNRINALGAVNAGFEAMRAAEQVGNLAQALSKNPIQAMSQDVSVSITYGEQKHIETQHQRGNTAEKSAINAGGKVNITTEGAGKDADITIAGADVSGKAGTHLNAAGEVNILAVDENHLEQSKNKSQGFNAGVAISYGSSGFAFGVTAGGNIAKGYGNGESQAWVGSQVGSLNSQTTIKSGTDTHIIGSQVKGKSVKVNAENLNIQSLQDTMKYEGKQESASAQVTVGYGASGSASYSKSKMKADMASVNQQAGIFAGDEGYDADVRKHTDLKGGTITSTEKAEQEGKNQFITNTLTSEDIQNHSEYSAKGFGLNGGFSVSGGEAPKDIAGVKLQEIGKNHKDGSSKVEMGGVAGVGSQGNWGVAKLATALLGQVSDKGSDSGITTASINTKNITIRDEQTQQKLTGKTVEETVQEINKANIHQQVNKVDIEQIKGDLERDLTTATNFVKNIHNIGDDIYYNIEKKEDNIFVKEKRASNCESIECIQYRELDINRLEVPKTKEEAEQLARMYAHGIMNKNDMERLQGAIQYGGKDYLENDVLVVRKPYTTLQSELTYTIFERLRAGLDMPSIFGASNASREQAKIWGLLEEYNRNNPNAQVDLKHLSHSLGVSSTKNAMNWASYKEMQLNNTTLNANTVGTSYPMTNKTIGGMLSLGLYDKGYAEKASGVFRDGKVEYAVAPGDIVGTGIGLPYLPGNLSIGIGNTNTTGDNFPRIPGRILTGDHNTAYYKDRKVIEFLNVSDKKENVDKIISYQNKVWGQISPKTKKIEFNNGRIIYNE
ncbi:hemagglutinin repeat-containing protein [Ursidibacter arcticus]